MKSTLKQLVQILPFFLLTGTMAQVPQSFSYQAVIRDNAGNLIQNENVSFRFSIRESSAGGAIIYRETQSSVTNSLGLVNLYVCQGAVVQGIFSAINWGTSAKFLQVEMDPSGGTVYTDMGTTQVLSVPYALFSHSSAGVAGVLPASNIPALAGDVTGAVNSNTVMRIRGRNVSATVPANGQALIYNSGSLQWEPQSVSGSGWSLNGNAGTIDGTHFLGSTDAISLSFRVNNEKSGKIDYSFPYNTFFGWKSGSSITGGGDNTAFGSEALASNNNGSRNVAIGKGSLFSSIAGYGNTAVGFNAQSNANSSSGINVTYNTSIGHHSLLGSAVPASNTGTYNTAAGAFSMSNNSSGTQNAAFGTNSLFNNSAGANNTAVGHSAMVQNTSGSRNIGIGQSALFSLTSGNENTGVGYHVLEQTIGSTGNTAIGSFAGGMVNNGNNNTFIGQGTAAGSASLTNSTALGTGTFITASNQVRVGQGATSIGGPVGWSTISDGRLKRNVIEYRHGLEFILKLKPVIYNLSPVQYPGQDDGLTSELEKITFSGFIAQEVEDAAKTLGFEFSGVDAPKNANDHYGLRYAEFVVPVIKAIQEQQAMIDAQQKIIDEMKQQNDLLKAALNAANSDISTIKLQLQRDTEASSK